MQLTTDRGCCNLTLQKSCLVIGGWFLFSILLNGLLSLHVGAISILGFIIEVAANVSLIFGSLKENRYLVLVWLFAAILFYIGWPIVFLGVLLNWNGYRATTGTDSLIISIIICLITLLLYAFCTRIVYSYYHELRQKQTQNTTTNNVV